MTAIDMPRSTAYLEQFATTAAEHAARADAAILSGRVRLIARLGAAIHARFWPARRPVELVAPLWRCEDGHLRSAPRDGRGRLLSRRWLAEAESFTAADRAWFTRPISAT